MLFECSGELRPEGECISEGRQRRGEGRFAPRKGEDLPQLMSLNQSLRTQAKVIHGNRSNQCQRSFVARAEVHRERPESGECTRERVAERANSPRRVHVGAPRLEQRRCTCVERATLARGVCTRMQAQRRADESGRPLQYELRSFASRAFASAPRGESHEREERSPSAVRSRTHSRAAPTQTAAVNASLRKARK